MCALSTVLMPLAILSGRAGADICLTSGAIFFLIHSYRDNDFHWAQTGWVKLLFGIWIYLVVTSFFAHSPATALKVSGPWVRYPLYTTMLATLTLPYERVRAALKIALLLVVSFFVFDAFYQYIMRVDIFGRPMHNSVRLTGPYHYPRLGLTTTWLAFPALMILHEKLASFPTIVRYLIFTTSGALILIAIFLSGDRSGFLLFLLGSISLFLLAFQKKIGYFIKRFFAYFLFGAVLAFTVYTGVNYLRDKTHPPTFSQQWKRTKQYTLKKITSSHPVQRQVDSTLHAIKNYKNNSYVKLFLDGFRAIKKHLIFGVGANNFQFHCTQSMLTPHKCGYRHPHNVMIDMLSLGGLMGMILFLSWIFWVFWKALKFIGQQPQNFLVKGLLIAFFIRLWPFVGTTSLMLSWAGTVFWFVSGWLTYYITRKNSTKPSA